MIVLFLAVTSATLAAGLAVAVALRMLPTVRLQLAGLALTAVALPVSAVSISGLAMFEGEDAHAVIVVSAAAAAAALVGAGLVERRIVVRLQRLRRASVMLAAGELGSRAPVGGPAELAELASSFNAMAQQLEDLFDSRRDLFVWASHDLRAPVTSLKAMLEAIEDGLVEPGEYLEALQGQVGILDGLVRDLFDMSRLGRGASPPEPQSVELRGMAGSCFRRFEAQARSQGVALRLSSPPTPLMALCTPDKVERVLSNLITNSLRYTPPGGSVEVSLADLGARVGVAVTDTGSGIPPDALEQAFQPFWRADRARPPGGGAGLGLAISRGLVEAQGGRIWAELPPGGGTRLCFELPAAPAFRPLPARVGAEQGRLQVAAPAPGALAGRDGHGL